MIAEKQMTFSADMLLVNSKVCELLARAFDFAVSIERDAKTWFAVDGAERIDVIARDGSGGVYVTFPQSPHVIYAASDGEAGVIAANVEEAVALVTTYPYWRDLLHSSGNGSIGKMRRAARRLEAAAQGDLEDQEDLDQLRITIRSALGLAESKDLITALHQCAASSDVIVRAKDGWPCKSLFGRFTTHGTDAP
jgi:hypothetical protein